MTEDKFLELVKKHQAQIYRYSLYLLDNPEDAKDITQETFMKAWEHRARLRPKTVHSWLLKCAQNSCFNALKQRKFQKPLTTGDDAELETLLYAQTARSHPSPDELVVEDELKAAVQAAIQKLPLNMRTVLIMRELEGMHFKEIAAILEKPEGTVKSDVRRARKQLRELLRSYWENQA